MKDIEEITSAWETWRDLVANPAFEDATGIESALATLNINGADLRTFMHRNLSEVSEGIQHAALYMLGRPATRPELLVHGMTMGVGLGAILAGREADITQNTLLTAKNELAREGALTPRTERIIDKAIEQCSIR